MIIASDIGLLASSVLPEAAADHSPVLSVRQLAGGDVNQAWRITTSHKAYFLKCNRPNAYPRLFECEAAGLRLLSSGGSVVTPEVVAYDDHGIFPYLILQFVEPGTPDHSSFDEAGRALAALHRKDAPVFGLSYHNYIGTLPQCNAFEADFCGFFLQRRLLPLARKAADAGLAPGSLITAIERLHQHIATVIPDEPPALLHGDLWQGNLLFSSDNHPVFIDPAVYYGHREADLAMTKLFGGFPASFYEAYNESFPLSPGWQHRVDLFNLYPLLVHLNLFGRAYLNQIEQILSRR